MTPEFNIADRSTWPEVMSVDHIAAIWDRSAKGIGAQCAKGRFMPAPRSGKPRRWSKTEVIAYLDRKSLSVVRRSA